MCKKIIYIILICLTLVSCSSNEDKLNDSNILTINKINSTFSEYGIELKKSSKEFSDEQNLNNSKPLIYTIGESQEIYILMYIFDSIQKRHEVMDEAREKGKSLVEWLNPSMYYAKNIIYKVVVTDPVSEDDLKRIEIIQNDIFYKLNDGRLRTYKGEGKNWTGIVELKYFQYFWKDDSDVLHMDSYHTERISLKYNGEDLEEIGQITYKYKTSSGGGSGVQELNKEGVIKSTSGGNGILPDEDDIYTVTIDWNGQTENLELENSKT